MVFFTCNRCGESLKKKAVEKHSYKCRTSQGLTCIDCHKVFGDDYATHLTCISEQEKYGGSNYDPKIMKGQKKQENWNDTLQKLTQESDIHPQVKNSLIKILQHQNIPRNPNKFKNFLTNCARLSPAITEKLIDYVFKKVAVINVEKLLDEVKEQKNSEEKDIQEKVKRKHEEEEDSNVQKKKKKKDKKNDSECPEVEMSQECTQNGDASTFDLTSEKSKKKKKKSKNKERDIEYEEKVDNVTNGDVPEEFSKEANEDGEVDTKSKVSKKTKKHEVPLELDSLHAEDVEPSNKKKKRKSKADETSESLHVENSDTTTSVETTVEAVTKKRKKSKSYNEKEENKENTQNINVKSTDDTKENKLGGIIGEEPEDVKVFNKSVEENETSTLDASEFKWKTAIKKALKTNDSKMKLKKLEKIVIEEYLQSLGKDQSTENEAKELFKKKINNDKFIIEDKYVKLI